MKPQKVTPASEALTRAIRILDDHWDCIQIVVANLDGEEVTLIDSDGYGDCATRIKMIRAWLKEQ